MGGAIVEIILLWTTQGILWVYLLIHGFNWKFRWNGNQTLLPSPPIFQLMIMYDGMGCPNLIDGWKSFASSWEEIPIDLSIASRPCALLNKNNDIALSLFFKKGNE